MIKKYRYKRTMYKIGDTTYKQINENELYCKNDENGFEVNLIFSASPEEHDKVINDISDILLKSLLK